MADWREALSASREEQGEEADWEQFLESRVDVHRLLRCLVVESILLVKGKRGVERCLAVSGVTRNNSLYFLDAPTVNYNEVFVFDAVTGESVESPDIFSFFAFEDGVCSTLLCAVLAVPKYRAAYVDHYRVFVEEVFGSSTALRPADRVTATLQFVLPWVQQDALWLLASDTTVEKFALDAERIKANLVWRYANVVEQFESL
jgi:hypothetical protein